MVQRAVHLSANPSAVQFHMRRRAVFTLFLSGVLIYLVAIGFSGLNRTVRAIGSAHIELLLLALLAIVGSYVCAALTYVCLSEKPLRFGATLLVQMSGGLANRLLPGGLGGLGINAWYLHACGQTLAVATVVVAINNLLGFIGNAGLLISTFVISPGFKLAVSLPHWTPLYDVVLTVVVLGFGLIATNRLWRQRLSGSLHEVRRYVAVTLKRPIPSLLALLSSMALTSFHVVALMLVIHSVGVPVGWKECLLAISAGAFAGAVVPTPGGLGGAEAGIATVLTASGIQASTAVGAALIYRFITYWLPLLPGYIALRVVEKRYL